MAAAVCCISMPVPDAGDNYSQAEGLVQYDINGQGAMHGCLSPPCQTAGLECMATGRQQSLKG